MHIQRTSYFYENLASFDENLRKRIHLENNMLGLKL